MRDSGIDFWASGRFTPIMRVIETIPFCDSILELRDATVASARSLAPSWSSVKSLAPSWLSPPLGEMDRVPLLYSTLALNEWICSLRKLLPISESVFYDVFLDTVFFGSKEVNDSWVRVLKVILHEDGGDGKSNAIDELKVKDLVEIVGKMIVGFNSYCPELRFFVSAEGYMDWMPAAAEEGDIVAILLGCPMPMAIRNIGRGYHRIVGPAYVYGIMKGEFMETDPVMRTFLLE